METSRAAGELGRFCASGRATFGAGQLRNRRNSVSERASVVQLGLRNESAANANANTNNDNNNLSLAPIQLALQIGIARELAHAGCLVSPAICLALLLLLIGFQRERATSLDSSLNELFERLPIASELTRLCALLDGVEFPENSPLAPNVLVLSRMLTCEQVPSGGERVFV